MSHDTCDDKPSQFSLTDKKDLQSVSSDFTLNLDIEETQSHKSDEDQELEDFLKKYRDLLSVPSLMNHKPVASHVNSPDQKV